jgi:hypothetical protein
MEDMIAYHLAELNRSLRRCGAVPEEFTMADIAELKSMGILVTPNNPELYKYVEERK